MSIVRPSTIATVYANAFEFAIAVAAVISSVAFFISPVSVASPSLHHALAGWDWTWYGLYLLGGLFVVAGLLLHGHDVRFGRRMLAGDGRLELAGLAFTSAALSVQVVALIHFGYAGTVGMLTYLCLLGAFVSRGRVLLAKRHAVYLKQVPAPKDGTG